MNGAQCILETLIASGIDTVFTNPGTSEMQFVAALDTVDGVSPVLGLFEGVCTGAADGYARMSGKTAATLLHLGPGLANGLANLHNAKRAGSAIVNIVGDHATYHRELDAPLTSDIKTLSGPMSHDVITLEDPQSVGADTATSITNAQLNGGQISTLIVPADIAWTELESTVGKSSAKSPLTIDVAILSASINSLKSNPTKTMILMTGQALLEDCIVIAESIRAATGCRIAMPTFNARLQRGAGRPTVERTPYLSEMAQPFFEGIENLILIGASEPVAFFAYPGKKSHLVADGCNIIKLAEKGHDAKSVLSQLSDALNTQPVGVGKGSFEMLAEPTGTLSPQTCAVSVTRHMPDGAVVVDEAITSGMLFHGVTENAAPHDWLDLTGGSIGQGMPLATGAAIAVPDQKIINLEGDGSAMYTIQALWTQARESLDVVTVIFNNQAYAVLQMEMMRTGASAIGEKAMSTLSIDNPAINFSALAQSMGVEAVRVETAEAFDDVFKAAMKRKGPFLIEAMI